jgi:hypothetical protein
VLPPYVEQGFISAQSNRLRNFLEERWRIGLPVLGIEFNPLTRSDPFIPVLQMALGTSTNGVGMNLPSFYGWQAHL